MKVFKFGGASVKDAPAVKNVATIVQQHPGPLLIVVSAMGKTTNALEEVFQHAENRQDYEPALQQVENYHYQLTAQLFSDSQHPVFARLQSQFTAIREYLQNLPPNRSDEHYDQIVSQGEFLSSLILYYYLVQSGFSAEWLDCRDCICTDCSWREARVDWLTTEKNIQNKLAPLLEQQIVITQGFLGGTTENRTTTLGREGSDFSGAIFAYCLGAESLTIWKDVAGFLNADPKFFLNPHKYDEISYQETVEMAYYGASVIHPKTIKPLANRHIPLYVKSFLQPQEPGTVIKDSKHEKLVPAFIRKANQCLLSFGVRDFTFVSERNLSVIFHALAELRFKINLMQNSAISFSVCTDYDADRLQLLQEQLQEQFIFHYNAGLLLYTIKNYTEDSINHLTNGKEILLEQRTRSTFQLVCREK
ncbi:aspartokinase [Adhaeribacter aerolatus]|uniref:Aspartokinase n=1 Tax=Adhaeribacter aerolatus TaxID=670289 RepID=A0A512ATL5_9BACT|nr:aspartate kinase [Adhaeribacter aerolatus]GEO03061.1 aspartokinase [Adhaeribacter aerolatus]